MPQGHSRLRYSRSTSREEWLCSREWVLAQLAREHRHVRYGDDGRLVFNERGGIISYTTYHRVWRETRALALSPTLASSPLARRPYDLRHSALSTWLCAVADPAGVAQRAGSVEVLLTRYAKCLYDRQSVDNQRMEGLLRAYDQPPESDQ